jgi:hypothetical protein
MPPIDLPLFHGDAALEANSRLIPQGDVYPRITRWWRYQERVQAELGPPWSGPPRYDLLFAPLPELRRPGADPAAVFAALGARWHVIELFPPEREVPGNALVIEAMRAGRRRVARFAPWKEGRESELPFEHEGLPSHPQAHFAAYLLRSLRLGPVIEVWELEDRRAGPVRGAGDRPGS